MPTAKDHSSARSSGVRGSTSRRKAILAPCVSASSTRELSSSAAEAGVRKTNQPHRNRRRPPPCTPFETASSRKYLPSSS